MPSDATQFVIVGLEGGRPDNNWDGEVHTTREAADASLAECHAAGYHSYALYELHPVTTPADCQVCTVSDEEGDY